MEPPKLGSTLKNLLRIKGISMAQLGEKIGVSQQTVSGWCTGRTEPTARYLVLMSDILEVSIDDLVRGTATHEAQDIKEIRHELDEIRDILRKMQAT